MDERNEYNFFNLAFAYGHLIYSGIVYFGGEGSYVGTKRGHYVIKMSEYFYIFFVYAGFLKCFPYGCLLRSFVIFSHSAGKTKIPRLPVKVKGSLGKHYIY